MVADAVDLVTRKAGEGSATRWESSGDGTYTIATLEHAPQGTSVTLHLKPEDADDELHDYTAPWKITELIKKYSDFISWPIRMEVEKTVPAVEEGGEPTTTVETETINSRTALWAKPKSEVSDEEYAEFYKHIAHAWDEPLEVIAMKGRRHLRISGRCCSSRRMRRSTCSTATGTPGCSCTSSASSSWVTATSWCPNTYGSSRVSSMHRTCRSTCLARSCSRIARSRSSVAA